MATRAQKTEVGIFLVACLALMGAGLFIISGFQHEERIPYWIEFKESVLGLNQGATVEYLGVPVGVVKDIYVDQNGYAHVTIEVSPSKVTLRQGVQAKLVLYSFATGVLCVSLEGGEPGAPILPDNAQIPAVMSLVAAVSSRAEQLLDDFTEVAAQVREILSGVSKEDVAHIVDNVDALLADARDFLQKTEDAIGGVKDDVSKALDGFTELTGDIRSVAKNVDKTVTVVREKVEVLNVTNTEKQLADALEQIAKLAEELGRTVQTLDQISRAALDKVDTVEFGLRETLRSASETLDSIQELTRSLEQDPAQLLRGKIRTDGGK